jgi:hypothetical protein
MKQPTTPSPLETLLADKERIRQQCRQQEQKLNEDFSYIRENAGSLLIFGIPSLLAGTFGGVKKKNDSSPAGYSPSADIQDISLSLSDYLSIGKTMLPTIWEIVKPAVITWGIRKITGYIFSGKKGKKSVSVSKP